MTIRIPKPSEQFDYYTSTPNIFIDELMRILPEGSFKILMVFARKLYGFHKERDHISSTQLEEITGMSNKTVSKHLNILIDNNIVIKTRKEDFRRGICAEYRLNTNVNINII